MSNYYQRIERSNDVAIKNDKIIVCRLDAKFTSKNGYSLTDMNEPFVKAIRETAKELSQTFNAIVYAESDEINIIFIEKNKLMQFVKKPLCSKINSYISQVVFECFNRHFESDTLVFFDTKVFGIQYSRFHSYLNYRYIYARNYFISHLLKKNHVPFDMMQNRTNKQRIKLLEEQYGVDFSTYDSYLKIGSLFILGDELHIADDFSSDIGDYVQESNGIVYLAVDSF